MAHNNMQHLAILTYTESWEGFLETSSNKIWLFNTGYFHALASSADFSSLELFPSPDTNTKTITAMLCLFTSSLCTLDRRPNVFSINSDTDHTLMINTTQSF